MEATWRSVPLRTFPTSIEPDDIPSIEQQSCSPTELPFTKEDFEPQMAHALELLPGCWMTVIAGIQHAINGLLSLTRTAFPF